MTFFSLSLRLSLLKIFLVTEYGSLEKRVSRMNEIILKNRMRPPGSWTAWFTGFRQQKTPLSEWCFALGRSLDKVLSILILA